MSTKTLALIALTTLWGFNEARADVVGDRVLLIANGGQCGASAKSFTRIKQLPDGSQIAEGGEFQVPNGSYLEITSVEYTTPYSTAWAADYLEYVDVAIRQRTGTARTTVLYAAYQNRSTYADNGDGAYVGIGEVVGTGGQTHHAAFPVGPLMGSAGRLCLSAKSSFFLFGGTARVRGRLLPSGEPPIITPPPGVHR